MSKVTPEEKAEYLISKGYAPFDTNFQELVELIRKSLKNTGKTHINDVSTVYIDKTKNSFTSSKK